MLLFLGLLLGGAGLAWAALSDVRHLLIPNAVHALLVLGFALAALGAGLALPDIGLRLAIGVIGFFVALVPFAKGWLGGGDVKLLAVCLPWLDPEAVPSFLLVMSLSGGLLALGAVIAALFRSATFGQALRNPLPYSLPIFLAWGLVAAPGFRGWGGA